MDGTKHGEAAGQLLLREQARLDGLSQLHLVLGGQQRHAADLPEVDPDQVAGRDPQAGFGVSAPDLDLGVVLRRHVDHIDALLGERAHRGVDGFRRKVGAVERHRHIGDGHGTALPS